MSPHVTQLKKSTSQPKFNRRSVSTPAPLVTSHTLSGPVKAVSPTATTARMPRWVGPGHSAPSVILEHPGAALVWAEPFNRKFPKVIPGDINRAIGWFKQTTGREVGTITLHPKLADLAKEVPEGISTQYRGGCLAFEIWLSPRPETIKANQPAQTGENVRGVARQPSTILLPINTKNSEGNKIKVSVAKDPRGRKHLDLPVADIKKLAGKGYGAKAIASRLREKGHQVSFMTVRRLLPSIIQPELKE